MERMKRVRNPPKTTCCFLIIIIIIIIMIIIIIIIAELSRAKRAQRSTMGKKMW